MFAARSHSLQSQIFAVALAIVTSATFIAASIAPAVGV
jgi:hypothetical protein